MKISDKGNYFFWSETKTDVDNGVCNIFIVEV